MTLALRATSRQRRTMFVVVLQPHTGIYGATLHIPPHPPNHSSTLAPPLARQRTPSMIAVDSSSTTHENTTHPPASLCMLSGCAKF
ncbi:hypothetical protein Hypma_013584 [Hypsizygus marmoreus]|uniref:Uncharacterized protein n=1 Tax=Hypsizygus marmoreus TaxID=39966 RepID=A0A369JKY7_HYPMA|nr:hypothetical protein Hypma_013584 [Hypsizygus marmoreus]